MQQEEFTYIVLIKDSEDKGGKFRRVPMWKELQNSGCWHQSILKLGLKILNEN